MLLNVIFFVVDFHSALEIRTEAFRFLVCHRTLANVNAVQKGMQCQIFCSLVMLRSFTLGGMNSDS